METKNEENGENNLEIEETNKNTDKNNYKKKPSRGMHIFSVVMFMLRRRRRRKSFNTRFWRRVVESVRKVHSDITIMPSSNFINTIVLPPPPLPPAETSHDGGVDNNDDEDDDDDHVPEAIEVFTAASSSSTSSGISGYASAMSLRDLDNHYYYNDDDEDNDDDDDDDECYSDGEGGDDMIDEKAEEFIVKFYEQMKMQNQVYTKRCKAKGIIIN